MFFDREAIGKKIAIVRADEVIPGEYVVVSPMFPHEPIAFEKVIMAEQVGDDMEFVVARQNGFISEFTTSIGNAVAVER